MKLLTVAIPCYNSESYMEHCINTLLTGGEEVEIIIVDDGSAKDRTGEIADRYAREYPTICRAIHQENGGHGEAVNTGLKNATGIFFKVVDSDDWVNKEAYDAILTKLDQLFDTENALEFTVEAGRPDSITEEKLRVLRDHGITRISINPQTMNQKTLDLIGRRHTVEMVKEKFLMARELGFDNINMDLIMGLPEEDLDDVRHTLEEIEALRPDSLTVHSLAIKRAARLNMFKEEYGGLKINNTPEMIAMSEACARRLGMEPYYLYRQKNMAGNFENVGYSLPGKACIYNILIMEELQTIAACGAGTTTKVVFPAENRRERCENVKEVEQYISRIDEMIGRKERILG